MEKKKRNFIKGTLVAGALLSVTALSATPNASSLFDYNALGSGAEVRSEILHSNYSAFNNFEATCGEKSEKKTEGKKTEAKCGEGKCGEKKGESAKAETTESGKKAAATTTSAAATTTTTTKKAESKSKEAKCGEGKCGVE